MPATRRSMIHIQIAKGSITNARMASTGPQALRRGCARTSARTSGRAISSMPIEGCNDGATDLRPSRWAGWFTPEPALSREAGRLPRQYHHSQQCVAPIELEPSRSLAIPSDEREPLTINASRLPALRHQQQIFVLTADRSPNNRGARRQLHRRHTPGRAAFARVLLGRGALDEAIRARHPQVPLVALADPVRADDRSARGQRDRLHALADAPGGPQITI